MPARDSLPARLVRIEGLPITAVLLILVALFMLVAPEVFLSYRIYMSFLANVPPLLVLAAGLTLLIAAGEIDLSFPRSWRCRGGCSPTASTTCRRPGSA